MWVHQIFQVQLLGNLLNWGMFFDVWLVSEHHNWYVFFQCFFLNHQLQLTWSNSKPEHIRTVNNKQDAVNFCGMINPQISVFWVSGHIMNLEVDPLPWKLMLLRRDCRSSLCSCLVRLFEIIENWSFSTVVESDNYEVGIYRISH